MVGAGKLACRDFLWCYWVTILQLTITFGPQYSHWNQHNTEYGSTSERILKIELKTAQFAQQNKRTIKYEN